MTLLHAAIRAGLAALAVALTPHAGAAATFSAQRGISLDLWVTWPNEEQWNDPSVLLPFPEWRRTVDVAKLRKLKEDGFDFARMQTDPAALLSAQTAGFREDILDNIVESVRLVQSAGLKVIVDLHAIPAGDNRSIGTDEILADPEIFDRYVELVRTVARRLSAEDPRRVALELMNEPTSDCAEPGSLWPERARRLFAAARASATRLTLVVSGDCWGGADGLEVLDPGDFPDDNLMWTFHSYAPFVLTHQSATWAGDFAPYVSGIPYPPHAVPRAELDAAVEKVRERIRADAPFHRRGGLLDYLDLQIAEIDTAAELEAVISEPFRRVAAWADTHGVRREDILFGEFGMIRQNYGYDYVMPAQWRSAYLRDVIAIAERHGFAWALFSYGGTFGVVERFDGSPVEPDVLDVVRHLSPR